MLKYLAVLQKNAIKFFSDNLGHNILALLRFLRKEVQTTSKWKLFKSSQKLVTLGLPLVIELRTLNLSI